MLALFRVVKEKEKKMMIKNIKKELEIHAHSFLLLILKHITKCVQYIMLTRTFRKGKYLDIPSNIRVE